MKTKNGNTKYDVPATVFKFVDYNITGENVYIKFGKDYDQYLYKKIWVPAKVVAEYPYFITFEILPHENQMGYGISKPYRLSIHKTKIAFGEVQIRKE